MMLAAYTVYLETKILLENSSKNIGIVYLGSRRETA